MYILFSCLGYSEARKELQLDYYDGPTTEKEKEYLNELKLQGFNNIEFAIPVISRTPKYGGHYGLSFKLNKRIDSTNLDSIKRVRDEIADHLYTTIIEDSTLIAINEITINVEVANGYYPTGEKPFLFKSFRKDSLARKHNFKVIQLGKDIYERVPYWKKVK